MQTHMNSGHETQWFQLIVRGFWIGALIACRKVTGQNIRFGGAVHLVCVPSEDHRAVESGL